MVRGQRRPVWAGARTKSGGCPGNPRVRLRAPIDLSPDGHWVAYTVQDNRKTRDPRKTHGTRAFSRTGVWFEAIGCSVWVTNLETGEAKQVSPGNHHSWGPVWSPDGKHLAFYSDRSGMARLWVWDQPSGALRQLSEETVRASFNFSVVSWTPDSKQILAKVLPTGMSVEQAAELTVQDLAAAG